MYVRDVMVRNHVGLYARPATFFIQCANSFSTASIWIEKDGKRVNAKSLLGVLSLGVVGGSAIKIMADSMDKTAEETAVNTLVKLVESGFSDVDQFLSHKPPVDNLGAVASPSSDTVNMPVQSSKDSVSVPSRSSIDSAVTSFR